VPVATSSWRQPSCQVSVVRMQAVKPELWARVRSEMVNSSSCGM
jgi:hypothetical protein